MEQTSSIYVAGHRGLVGSAIVRMLTARGFKNLITKPRSELDLRDRSAVDAFFRVHRPEYVFLAAARVGGILANSTYPVEFLLENLEIHTHILRAAHEHKTKKLLFLGSSCIYPKMASQPIGEDALLTGPLEPTNKPYAIAKIAGITLCQSYRKEFGDSFISVMPTNLYGPNDNFDLKTSHVLPALIRKIHDAKKTGAPSVLLWGTGRPRREFLHVDDLADACLFLMEKYDDPEIINVGTGEDLSIDELGQMVAEVIGYGGSILYDPAKPDGTPRKLLNVAKIHGLGWRHSIPLKEGIEMTYDWFLNNYEKVAV
ncbi:GDP-fucose synthetase [Candidatus Peribacteria bacterium RIFCSPLOWO2_01_FULL_51_18]|nr:MAG: GDP-fucose synthetase [Candidatus Peribacteria bacterium RIFCSPLOWO2_01_FULL_51_18]